MISVFTIDGNSPILAKDPPKTLEPISFSFQSQREVRFEYNLQAIPNEMFEVKMLKKSLFRNLYYRKIRLE